MTQALSLAQLASMVGGTLSQGAPDALIAGLNSLRDAEPGEVTFLGNSRYQSLLSTTRASAVLVEDCSVVVRDDIAVIEVENPTFAFSKVVDHFGPASSEVTWGVHPTAVIDPSAQFEPTRVCIGPQVVVGRNVKIGNGCVIHSCAYVGDEVVIGKDCVIHPNAVIRERCLLGNRVTIHSGAVIGSDGFGYELKEGRHLKIPQVGTVQIDDDVEIGSCTTIDRARFGRTWIGEGTKIDNLVQIAHNCIIGKHCVLVSQVGISGSTRVEDYVTMGGQVGVAGHLEIAGKVLILGKAGVTKDITAPGAYTGFPARPLMEGRKLMAYPSKIPQLMQRMKELEGRLAALEGRPSD